MNVNTAFLPPVVKTVIQSLQSASDPAGIRLSLRPPTELEGADATSHHDGVFEEAGRRGLTRELFIGLIEYACQDARNISLEPDAFYMIRAPLGRIADEQLQAELEGTVEAGRLGPARICFEIPEMSFRDSFNVAGVYGLQARGFQLSLAAFGSGIAPFDALKHLPLSFVQISPSFVRTMLQDPFSGELVRCSNLIAHLRDTRAIAAGTDSVDHLNMLRALGVDYAEGPAI